METMVQYGSRQLRNFVIPGRKVLIDVYEIVKFQGDADVIDKFEFEDVVWWEMPNLREDVEKLKAVVMEAGLEPDPFNEYLLLTFKDGSQKLFRNSFVDMFILPG